MKRKSGPIKMRNAGKHTRLIYGIPCKLCGAEFADPLSMLLHLATEHPVQLAQHPAAQTILSKVQQASYDFGVTLADLLKGKS
jgi:hypothetical protein